MLARKGAVSRQLCMGGYLCFSNETYNRANVNNGPRIVQNNKTLHYNVDTKSVNKLIGPVSFSSLGSRFVKHLLPNDYKTSVPPNYIGYSKIYALGAFASSAAMVLSTQSLLYAVGLGAGAIPLSAAINWVLKDGLGQLGGVLFTSFVNNKFDSDPKRWRIVAALSVDGAMYLEALAPLFPALFLPLAAIANTGKSISWLAASATRAGIHLSFAKKGNLADITGKAGSQGVVASTAGNFFGIFLSPFIGSDPYNILACVVALSTVHLGSMYRALGYVSLNTLNMQRGEIVTRRYLESVDNGGEHRLQSMTPESVGDQEIILGRNLNYLFSGFDSKLIVGPPIENVCNVMSMLGVNDQEGDDNFQTFLKNLRAQKFAVFDYSSSGNKSGCSNVALYFDDSATTKEMLMGYLISMHYIMSLEVEAERGRTVDKKILLEKSHLFGDRMIDDYVSKLKSNGWNVDNIYIDEKNMGRLFQDMSSDA